MIKYKIYDMSVRYIHRNKSHYNDMCVNMDMKYWLRFVKDNRQMGDT